MMPIGFEGRLAVVVMSVPRVRNVDAVTQALHAIQSDYDWPRLHTNFDLSEEGVGAAITAATRMSALKATVVPGMVEGA